MEKITQEQLEQNRYIGWYVENGIVKQKINISTGEERIVGELDLPEGVFVPKEIVEEAMKKSDGFAQPSTQPSIIKSFRERFVAPKPFDDTIYSYKAEVFEQFLLEMDAQIRKEIGESVEKLKVQHNDYCEWLEDNEMPCDCGVGMFNHGISQALQLINSETKPR